MRNEFMEVIKNHIIKVAEQEVPHKISIPHFLLRFYMMELKKLQYKVKVHTTENGPVQLEFTK